MQARYKRDHGGDEAHRLTTIWGGKARTRACPLGPTEGSVVVRRASGRGASSNTDRTCQINGSLRAPGFTAHRRKPVTRSTRAGSPGGRSRRGRRGGGGRRRGGRLDPAG